MSRLYKRGKTWWASYRDAAGRPQRRSLHTESKPVARQRLRAAELADTNRPQDRTLGDAMTYLLKTVYAGRRPATVKSYSQKARHIVRLVGEDTPCSRIDREAWQKYRAARLREKASEHSIHKEAVVLRLALKEQGIEGVIPRVSSGYVPRERYLTFEQFIALLAALETTKCKGELLRKRRLWLRLAVFLGARDSELESLAWEDVRLDKRLLRLRGTKTRRSDRYVPIPPALVPWLEEVPEAKRKGKVVARWSTKRRDLAAAWWKVVGWSPDSKSWSKGPKHGGVSIKGAPRISPNDLRRTYASWLKQAGADSQAVAELLGHASTRMVEAVYGRLNEDAYRRTVALLPEGEDEE